MNKLKQSSIIDFIITNLLIFLITFIWLKFIIRSRFLVITLSLLILCCVNFFVLYKKFKKNKSLKIKNEFNCDLTGYFLTLLSNSYKENLKFFYNIFFIEYNFVELTENFILINGNIDNFIAKKQNKILSLKIFKKNFYSIKSQKNYQNFLNKFIKAKIKKNIGNLLLSKNIKKDMTFFCKKKEAKSFIVLPLFEAEIINFEIVLRKISPFINKYEDIVILCNQIKVNDKQKLENFKNITLKIFEKDEIFKNIFQKTNIYPKIIFEYKKRQKINFKTAFLYSLNKSNAKRYFFSGLFIFFCSFFVKYNLYYVIFSSVMFFLCLISIKNKQIT